MKSKFDAQEPLGKSLRKWWEDLQNHTGERAELRRAKNISDIILLPAYHRACIRFKPFLKDEDNWEIRLAAIIGLLAHVRTTSDKKLALSMAGKPKPELSELRFRRLIQRNRDDLYIAMIRVIRLLDNKVNLYDLANSVYYWGEKIKRDWAFDYFPNAPEKTSN